MNKKTILLITFLTCTIWTGPGNILARSTKPLKTKNYYAELVPEKDHSKTEVILITGYGSIETAVDSMKKGAYDYITKPINDTEIKIAIAKIVEKRNIIDENEKLKQILAKQILKYHNLRLTIHL